MSTINQELGVRQFERSKLHPDPENPSWVLYRNEHGRLMEERDGKVRALVGVAVNRMFDMLVQK